MSQFRTFGQRDNQRQSDGDFSFLGIDMKHDRPLSLGLVPKSINKRMRTGVAATRPGTRTPTDFNPNPAFVSVILTTCVYSNPNGQEVMLAVEWGKNSVWQFQYGQVPKTIPLPAPITLYPVCMLQAFDKVLILHGGHPVLIWNGLDFVGGFQVMPKLDPADLSTNLIPASVSYAITFQNRVIYIDFASDTVYVSDINDPSSYDNVYGAIRINSGQGDKIMTMHGFNNEMVIIFMNRSIHRLFNFSADLSQAAQDVITDELGAVGREAAVQVSGDIVFMSRAGLYSISQVLQNKIITQPVPLSDLIAPTLELIDWKNIFEVGEISMAVLNEYLFVALISVGGASPQSIFVYNTVTGHWESFDAWEDPLLFISELRVTLYQGVRRLYGINWGDGDAVPPQPWRIYLLYEGITDQTPDIAGTIVTRSVNDILETRGYGAPADIYGRRSGFDSFKRFGNLSLAVRTLNPSFSVSALTDGFNEVKLLTPTPITKNPAKFYIWGHPDYPASGDPNEPKREDYYTGSETEWVAQDMSNLIPGNLDLLPAVDAEMLGGPTTESLERRQIRVLGRWCSIRVENTQGTCDIMGVSVDYDERRRDSMTSA